MLKCGLGQYIDTVLKIKLIFYRKELKNDVLVRNFLDGKLDAKITGEVLNILPIDFFESVIGKEKIEKHFFKELVDYFRNLNFDEKDIALFIRVILEKYDIIGNPLIDLLIDYDIAVDKYKKNLSIRDKLWLTVNEKLIKEIEKEYILNGYFPFIRYEYYIQALKKMKYNPDLDDEKYQIICENIIELLKTNFYNENEKKELKNALNKYTEFGKYIDDDYKEIDFNKQKIGELNLEELKKVDYNGQIIPENLAFEILRKYQYVDTELKKIQVQMAIKSLVHHRIKRVGINTNVFFGKKEGKLAYHLGNDIWLNIDLIAKMKYGANEIVQYLGHEMNHLIDDDNINKFQIDYITFLELEQKVIRKYYPEFYINAFNHPNILGEINSDIEGYYLELKYLDEIHRNKGWTEMKLTNAKGEIVNMKKSPSGNFKLGDKVLCIDLREFFRRIIKNNPEVFTMYNGIFNIKYNQDGTEKDIDTLIDDFFEITNIPLVDETKKENMGEMEKNSLRDLRLDYLYSIYSGIIKDRLQNAEKISNELGKKIDCFYQMNLISIPMLKQYYDEVKPLDIIDAMTRYDLKKYMFKIEQEKNR